MSKYENQHGGTEYSTPDGTESFVRVDVWSLDETDEVITSYGDAVAAMQAKPESDPTSWAFQAAIHGSLSANPRQGWNECRHQSWYFLAWHRMYLYYFERIVRQYVVDSGGPITWALPYWNYDGGGNHNTLPTAFRSPTRADGSPNALYIAQRRAGINAGAGLPAAITSPALALSRPNFTGTAEFGGGAASPLGQFAGQTGRCEQTPHNDIHVAIDGLMGNPDTAALDPIFWLHHANIDRLWWLWQQQHANPTDSAWTSQSFTFADVAGAASASLSCSGVEDTVQQLRYTYDEVMSMANAPEPGPAEKPESLAASKPSPERELVGASTSPVELTGDEARVPVHLDAEAAAAAASGTSGRAHLDLDEIEAASDPGAIYGVYVNLPPNPTENDLREHHVGNVSLFGVERARNPRRDEPPHSLRLSMDITDVLARLAAQGRSASADRLEVTFRPVTLTPPPDDAAAAAAIAEPQKHPDVPITIGRVSLHRV